MKYLFILALSFIFVGANAQSPFKALAKPSFYHTNAQLRANALTAPAPDSTMNAWRFTGPMGGYLYTANGQAVVTGVGFGWTHNKWVDSTGKWYTTIAVNAIALAGGNVPPTLSPFTVMSAGIALGLFNQLVQIGPVYNFAGSFGVFATISIPLNN